MIVAETTGAAHTLPAGGGASSGIGACGSEPAPRPDSASRRWARLAARGLRLLWGLFPLTFLGLCVLAACSLAFWFVGVGRLDMVLLVATLAGACILLFTIVTTCLTAAIVWWRLRGARSRSGLVLEAGSPWPTGLEFHIPTWIPLGSVEWRWETGRPRGGTPALLPGPAWRLRLARLLGRALESVLGRAVVSGENPPETWLARLPGGWPPHPSSRVFEMVIPRRRARMRHVARRVTVRDMLGMSALSWTFDEAVDLSVAPWRGHLDRMPSISGFVGGDDHSDPCGDPYGDRVDMRQYVPGDSPRMILWKVYARNRKLMVRINERALTVRPRGCAYLVAGAGDEPSAGVARVILERGVLGEPWCFGADGSGDVVSTLGQTMPLVAASGDFSGPTMFPVFLERVERQGYGYCILVVPPVPGPWVEPVAAALARTSLRVFVFLGIDSLDASGAVPPMWKRVLLRTPPERPVTLDDLRAVARGLGPVAARPWVVERPTGHVYGGVEVTQTTTQGMGGSPWRG